MDAVSSKTFQPIQPDGYVLSSPGTETPKIEITETETLCQSPLSPTGCDVSLSEWDDYHHHGDTCGQGDYLAEQSPRHHQHDPCDSRPGSLSRRSEGGPGKSPSPSRNSPRRHSPVPYSPKRQNRARSSASSVASEEYPDVTLSPRRHSPVAVLPHVDRPCSLSLASAGPEEFICVSYSDPFSSPTITHTSEAILAISINCNHDGEGDQDVEMTSSDVNNGDVSSAVGVTDTSSSPLLSSARTSVNDDKPSLQVDNFQGSSHKDISDSQDENRCDISDVPEVKPYAENCNSASLEGVTSGNGNCQSVTVSENETKVLGKVAAESKPIKENVKNDVPDGVESMEGEDDFRVDEVTDSDSSSDDEMEDFVSLPHPYGDSMMSVGYSPGVGVTSSSKSPDFQSCASLQSDNQYASLASCSQNQNYSSQRTSCDGSEHIFTATTSSFDSNACVTAQRTAVDVDRKQSSQSCVDSGQVQSLPDNFNSLPCTSTIRRASFPDHHSGVCSTTLSSSSSKEASPRRSFSHHAGKTPEDFALSCIVGSPPLNFPHCQQAVMVHCPLPSPYDPLLPTPPIVLTPHTSYDDLNTDTNNDDEQTAERDCQSHYSTVRGTDQGSSEGTKAGPSPRPDISRSRSFPKLNESDSDQFKEPHLAWPVLGQSQSGDNTDITVCEQDEHSRGRQTVPPNSGGEVTDMDDLSNTARSSCLPTSPSNRAAVIGRLRRVVERRLSGTSESLEAAPQDG